MQNFLQPNMRRRTGRLCGSFEDEIKKLHAEASDVKNEANGCKNIKRKAEIKLEMS